MNNFESLVVKSTVLPDKSKVH